jgi:hypothetical protein
MLGAYVELFLLMIVGIQCLPDNGTSAKDLGIWHFSMTLPQLTAPLIGGILENFITLKI